MELNCASDLTPRHSDIRKIFGTKPDVKFFRVTPYLEVPSGILERAKKRHYAILIPGGAKGVPKKIKSPSI